jgi:DNA-binding NarL/FixJ family response regulator
LLLDLDLEGGAADPRVVEGLIEDGVAVLVVSAMGWPSLVREMVIAGVSGFVAKRDPTQSLLKAVETVIDGGSWNSSELAAILADSPVRPALSTQEERALQLYATGLKMSSVARQMGVQPETAKDYIDRVRKKYAALGRDVRTKTELYIAAVADGLIKPSQD